LYKSSDAFHQSTIIRLWCYNRKNDNKNILLSADVRGKVILSEIINDNNNNTRLNFLSRYNNCHFGPIRFLKDLKSSQFFISFTPKEPLKIWNNLTQDLSLILNEYSSNLLQAIEIVEDSKGIVLVYSDGLMELIELDYNRYYTNIDVKLSQLKKNIFNKNHAISNLML